MMNQTNTLKLNAYLNECVKQGVSCGFVVGLVKKNDTWFTCVGDKQVLPTKEKTSVDTIYDLASVSKVLTTTTLILKLVEEGLISLKTPVCEVLPLFKHSKILIKHLLNHTSGFAPDIVGYKQMSEQEAYTAMYNMELEYPTGEKVVYSDVNFILLGKVIEQLKGSLQAYAQSAMFDPLNMKDTCYNPSNEVYDRLASYEDISSRGGIVKGVVHDGKAFLFKGISGHAGVFSTVEDISHFMQMVLNGGVYNGVQYLSEYSINLLKTITTPNLNEKRSVGWVVSDENYALGDYASDTTLFHTGFSGPSLLVDFKKEVGVIILTNRVHPSRESKKLLAVRNQIHNLAFLAF